MAMNIKVHGSKKSEGVSDALKSNAYLDGMDKLQAAFREVEKVLDEHGLELVLDTRGDYMLTAVPKELNGKLGDLSKSEIETLLDSTPDVSTPKHLISVLPYTV